MRKEYDFTKGIRGKFYKPHDAVKIVINYGKVKNQPVFEIFRDSDDCFRFRLKDGSGKIIFTSDEYRNKSACLKSIKILQEKSPVANIIESIA